MKHLVAITLAGALTWAFLAVLGPVTGSVARVWLSLDAGQQATLKVLLPLLMAVPGILMMLKRRRLKNEE